MAIPQKSNSAFLTIGELAETLGLPQHILRYWETKFRQLRPLQRAGNRRYYRPEDVALASQINKWLNVEGYTVKGVQKLLTGKSVTEADQVSPVSVAPPAAAPIRSDILPALIAIRYTLSRAIAQDDLAARV
jgi:DNA-binding transcriptional MerR regulator